MSFLMLLQLTDVHMEISRSNQKADELSKQINIQLSLKNFRLENVSIKQNGSYLTSYAIVVHGFSRTVCMWSLIQALPVAKIQ